MTHDMINDTLNPYYELFVRIVIKFGVTNSSEILKTPVKEIVVFQKLIKNDNAISQTQLQFRVGQTKERIPSLLRLAYEVVKRNNALKKDFYNKSKMPQDIQDNLQRIKPFKFLGQTPLSDKIFNSFSLSSQR